MSTQKLVRTGLLLAVALCFQIGFRQFAQPLVGPLVNMTLILTTLIVGPIGGIIVGVFTPLVAFMLGITGVPILVPVIAIGNGIFVFSFYLSNKIIKFKINYVISIVVSSVLKFAFLFISVRTLLPLFMPKVPGAIIAAFSLPQLYTALVGGALAIALYQIIKKHID